MLPNPPDLPNLRVKVKVLFFVGEHCTTNSPAC